MVTMDYSVEASITKTFFKTVQNKIHFAIHGKTAAELITEDHCRKYRY